MNIFLTLTSILIIVFSLVPAQLYAAANTYYVTQSGNGAEAARAWGTLGVSQILTTRTTGFRLTIEQNRPWRYGLFFKHHHDKHYPSCCCKRKSRKLYYARRMAGRHL